MTNTAPPMEFSEQLKSSVDIVSVIGDYVRLKRVGAGPRHVGLCPFHQEKTPSFSVHGQLQFYKCFGCGVGGDVYSFLMKVENLGFFDALKLLAERTGTPMPKRDGHDDEESRHRAALHRMHEIAVQAFRGNLEGTQGASARAYLEQRGLTAKLASHFELGLSDPSGQQLVRRFEQERFPPEQMELSGLVSRRESGGFYDRFRGRLMFPIHNESGKVIGFGGRALSDEDQPKYLNSPETAIYKKTHVLYNLHRAKEGIRKHHRAILVEGYMDVIGVYGAGVTEVVASCGTSFTAQQARSVKRLSPAVVVNLDPDNAGAEGTARSIELLLAEGISIKVLELPQGLDPDEFVKSMGTEAYRLRAEKAQDYYTWLAVRTRSKFDTQTAEGRTAAFEFLLPKVRLMPNEVERVAMAAQVADILGIEREFVYRYFRNNGGRAASVPKSETRAMDPSLFREASLLQAVLNHDDLRDQVVGVLRPMPAVSRFRTHAIFEAVFGLVDAGAPVSFRHVEAKLGPEEQALLHSLFLGELAVEELGTVDQVIACIRTIEHEDRRLRASELKLRIKDASLAGDIQTALRWTEELRGLERA